MCKALSAAGHHVVALVRNPEKAEAVELSAIGVELLKGDTKCAPCFVFVASRYSLRHAWQRSYTPRYASNGNGRDVRLGSVAQRELGAFEFTLGACSAAFLYVVNLRYFLG